MTGYTGALFDPVNGMPVFPTAGSATNSIYANAYYRYNPTANTYTLLNGSPSASGCGTADATHWGNGHDYRQRTIDAPRQRLVVVGGVNQNCNGGSPPNDSPRSQMYYISLLDGTATRTIPANMPATLYDAALVHDTNLDIYFMYGTALPNAYWVYCPTETVNAAQIVAGCTTAQDWYAKLPASGQPGAVIALQMYFDSAVNKIIFFGGTNQANSVQYNQTWTYDLATRTWAQVGQTNPPPATNTQIGQPGTAWKQSTRQLFYRCIGGAGCPKDYVYSAASDTWSEMASTGTGETNAGGNLLIYDTVRNSLISYSGSQNSAPTVWVGQISPASNASASGVSLRGSMRMK